MKFTFDASGDREMPLIIGLMPILPRHLIDPERFEKTTPRRRRSAAALTPSPRSIPARASSSGAIPTIGAAILPSIAGSTISTRSASTITATPAACSKPSNRGLCACATRTTRPAGRKATTSPRLRDGRVRQRGAAGRNAGRHVGARVQHAASDLRRPARAPGADQAVRFRMGEPHALSRPVCAHGKLFRPLGAELARAPGRRRPSARCSRLSPIAVKPAIMDGSFAFPVSDGSGENREGRREALQLLEAAGYRLTGGKLINMATGEPVRHSRSWRRRAPRSGCCSPMRGL